MSNGRFILLAVLVGIALVVASLFVTNEYYVFAAYFVMQYVVLATAWNILGGIRYSHDAKSGVEHTRQLCFALPTCGFDPARRSFLAFVVSPTPPEKLI